MPTTSTGTERKSTIASVAVPALAAPVSSAPADDCDRMAIAFVQAVPPAAEPLPVGPAAKEPTPSNKPLLLLPPPEQNSTPPHELTFPGRPALLELPTRVLPPHHVESQIGAPEEEPASCFWFKAEYLLWWTKGSPLPPLLTTASAAEPGPDSKRTGSLGLPNTTILYGGNSDAADGARSGARFMLGFWITEGGRLGVELGGFFTQRLVDNFQTTSLGLPLLYRPFIDPFTGAQNVLPVASLTVPGQSPQAGAFAAGHDSSFWGTEANLRAALLTNESYALDAIVGFRMLALEEELRMASDAEDIGAMPFFPSFFFEDRFRTRNYFYGGQFGLAGGTDLGPLTLDVKALVGLGATTQDVTIMGTSTVSGPGFAPKTFGTGFFATDTNSGTFHRTVFSVVPQVCLKLGYQVTDYLHVFAGYDFLYWSDVARPGAQIDQTVNTLHLVGGPGGPPNHPAFVFTSSDFWAQGLTLGMTLQF
jgi:hypothetical protein